VERAPDIAVFSVLPGELMCDEIPVFAGQRLIDIGCGTLAATALLTAILFT